MEETVDERLLESSAVNDCDCVSVSDVESEMEVEIDFEIVGSSENDTDGDKLDEDESDNEIVVDLESSLLREKLDDSLKLQVSDAEPVRAGGDRVAEIDRLHVTSFDSDGELLNVNVPKLTEI